MKSARLFVTILVFLLLPAIACQAAAGLLSAPATLESPPAPGAVMTPQHDQTTEAAPTSQTFNAPSPTPVFTETPVPSATPEPSATATFAPSPSFVPDPNATQLQLQVFNELWRIVAEEYLYPDFNGLDWDLIYEEYQARIEAGMSSFDFYLAMDELLYRLADDHSIFLSPEETIQANSEYAGGFNYVGIGILNRTVVERRRLVVLLVFPGSPAEEAGIQPHDSILAVDGEPAVDENGFRTERLRGPEGSLVSLTVQSPGEEPREVPVTRRRVAGPMPAPYETFVTPGGKRIGYIQLVTFNDLTVIDQVGAALRALTAEAPLDGLILDNRHNGGGANTVLEGVLSYFTQGLVGYFVNRWEERPLYIEAVDVNGSQRLPLVVLVGEDTASFGEVFAGILQDLERATLIGVPTMANVETLYVYDFVDGSSAWIAHDTFRPVNSNPDWETTGVIPDIAVSSEWDQITQATDPVINAALSFFD